MKNINFLVLALLVLSFAIFNTSCTESSETNHETSEAPVEATPSPEVIVEHGKYLVTIMGCNDCHSPKRMGAQGPEVIPELMLSGFPADRPIVPFTDPMIKEGFAMFYPDLTAGAGPWGVSFAANLTPDETGLGEWSEEQFKKAITEGKYKGLDGGRMLLPPMPWGNYVSMTDEDIHAMFMYLQSIKPVSNIPPAPVPPTEM